MKRWAKIATVKERRGHARTTLLLRIRIRTADGEASGFLRNLSQSGAMVDADLALASGQRIELLCGERTIAAAVAWTDQRRFGLTFETTLSEVEVEALVLSQRKRFAR